MVSTLREPLSQSGNLVGQPGVASLLLRSGYGLPQHRSRLLLTSAPKTGPALFAGPGPRWQSSPRRTVPTALASGPPPAAPGLRRGAGPARAAGRSRWPRPLDRQKLGDA